MTLLKLLEEGHFYEIQRSPGHRDDLEDQAVSYAGPVSYTHLRAHET